ncbi:MAG: hypothetical protein QOJ81_1128 [Chloroflexota bacterium]|nr:hypothetical protein [Chloroflexota bacterium]
MKDSNGSDPIDRLRAANPARADEVPDASLARVSASVQEHIMTHEQKNSTSPRARLRPLALLGGAVLTGAFALALASSAGLGGQVPGSTASPDPGNGHVHGGGGMAMCIRYDPELLPTFDAVFDGTVTAISGDQVTFEVNQGWKDAAGSITLTAPDTSVALLGPMPEFAVGSRYLVTAASGNVNGCGYTLEYDAAEAANWAAAFSN